VGGKRLQQQTKHYLGYSLLFTSSVFFIKHSVDVFLRFMLHVLVLRVRFASRFTREISRSASLSMKATKKDMKRALEMLAEEKCPRT
jgi:hypothetical protein